MSGKKSLICFASAILLAACDRSPQAKEARFLKRGASMLTAKNYSRAAIEFHNAAQAAPQDAEPYYQMGLAYLGSGDPRAALGAFKKATELNPKHPGAQLKLAELLANSRSKDLIELARKQLQELLSTTPDNPEALEAMAVTDYKLGKDADGTELLVHELEKPRANCGRRCC